MSIKSCVICSRPAVVGKTQVLNSLGRSRVFCHCPNCEHWWLEPMPDSDELKSYYQSRTGMVTTGYVQQYPRKKLKHFCRILKKHGLLATSPVLEIGPGPVGITPLLPSGVTYIAVEPGIAYSKSLKQSAEKKQLDFYGYDSIDMVPDDKRFNMLFTNAVFEHLIDPLDTFRLAVRHLNAGAAVVFGVPDRNVEILESAFIPSGLFKEIAYGENHLHSFSESSVKIMFNQMGIDFIATDHMLAAGLVSAYKRLSKSLEYGVINQRLTSARWALNNLKALLQYRIANTLIDRRNPGDDRCEAIYIGVKR